MNNTNRYAPRYAPRQPTYHAIPEPPQKKRGTLRLVIELIVVVIVLITSLIIYQHLENKPTTNDPQIRSGLYGYCIDDRHEGTAPGADVQSWKCNGTNAQDWVVSGNHIVRNSMYCLSISGNGKQQGDKIVQNKCSSAKDQQWEHYMDGYQNPTSGLCLDVPSAHTDTQLILDSCNDMTRLSESWTPAYWPGQISDPADVNCNTGSRGLRVACFAERQWAAWQVGATIHPALLNDYTDGNPDEEWCADFVSYVYKEAGYPFANGERNGWDQYTAGDVQYMGFTVHSAGSYTPKPGDVAFFDYPGGHVEIVVSGGAHPTFVYGDAGTIDPSTNNGEMSENSFTNDGGAGQVIYYLSPN
jgi:hypothetical protein